MPNQDPPIARELLSHQAFLRRLASDLVGDEADDLVQDVWQRALERPPHHGRQLRGWLARIARNLAANRWRGEARRAQREADKASEQPAEEELEARFETRKELVEALDSLNSSSRETILLRYFEGLAPRDIAKRQGTPVATVKTRLRRGLAQLREALDERYDGDRARWMWAVTALGVPVDSAGSGALVIGGIAMGTMMKVSAAALVAAACVYFVTRTPEVDSPQLAANPPATGAEPADSTVASLPAAPKAEVARRSPVAEGPRDDKQAAVGADLLRVVLDGITAEEALGATIRLTGVDRSDAWPAGIQDTWLGEGLTSEFELDPRLASARELDVEVVHPHHLKRKARIELSDGVRLSNGTTVHQVQVRLVRPEFWPEFTLSVLDANTRAHLEDIELRLAPGVGSARWGRNGTNSLIEKGLNSPIVLMGGRNAEEPEAAVAGMALSPAAGALPRLVELTRHFGPERGVILSARAPGYAWGSITLDVTKGDRELLLEPSTALRVQVTNAQLERYAALGTEPMLCVYWIRPDRGNQYVHFARLDERLVAEGLQLDDMTPGEYRVTVELGEGLWRERPQLAFEELAGNLALVAGETRELVLALKDPPAGAPERATLGGVISFPTPTPAWDEEEVRLQLYFQPTQRVRKPDVELSLANLQPVGGALPSWSFRVEELPVGMYRVQLLPFLEVWMIELTPDGAEDLELVLPELAEVRVETVDARTGERVLLDEFYFKHREVAPGQEQNDWAQAVTEEPGRFRFWTAPGRVAVWPRFQSRLGYGLRWEEHDLDPGVQSLRFELSPVYAMRFEFREEGVALPVGDPGMYVMKNIRAVGHEGRVTGDGLQSDMRVEVSAPGLYEIHFDGLNPERYLPLPPRIVDVREGETPEVIVELRRK